MKWNCYKTLIGCIGLVLFLVFCSAGYAQKTVQMDPKEYAEYRLTKIQQEVNAIVQDLRAKNPEAYKKLDGLQSEAMKIQEEYQKTQAPAKAPAKK